VAENVVPPWRVRGPRRSTPRAFVSPAVRRAADAAGVDVAALTGSGLDGRVTRGDVEHAVATTTAAMRDTDPRDEVVALNPVQRRTGEHLVHSKQTAAHAFVAMEVDFERLDPVRRAAGLTFLPFIAYAVVDAVREFPWINATIEGDEVVARVAVHLGIAVDLEHRGLIVPVVRDAQDKRLRALARDIAEMARRARAKALSPDDVVGGTFTITNPGPAGTAVSVPIINQPQVAILSTDGVARRPVVVTGPGGRDVIDVRATGVLGLSFDHRAFDLRYAAAFLSRVRERLESGDWDAGAGPLLQ
jgi:pyruvate dehydrogenase E2 component (dihydrolipoyllysine-residue acetyltransferase)